MKKLIRILLIFSILSLTGCEFLRQVAGRPSEQEIMLKKDNIEKRKKAKADSIKLMQEKARKIELARKDSINGMVAIEQMGMHISFDFRYGRPIEEVGRKYNIVIGVFRQNLTAAEMMKWAIDKGYCPYYIRFMDNIKTVCLCGGDSLSAVADTVSSAKAAGVCPKDAWLYVTPEK